MEGLGFTATALAHPNRGDQRQAQRAAKGGEERRKGDVGVGLTVLFTAFTREQFESIFHGKLFWRSDAQVAAMSPPHGEVDDFGRVSDRRRCRLLPVDLNCKASRPHLIATTTDTVAGIEVLWKN